jgi:hypothetical protein
MGPANKFKFQANQHIPWYPGCLNAARLKIRDYGRWHCRSSPSQYGYKMTLSRHYQAIPCLQLATHAAQSSCYAIEAVNHIYYTYIQDCKPGGNAQQSEELVHRPVNMMCGYINMVCGYINMMCISPAHAHIQLPVRQTSLGSVSWMWQIQRPRSAGWHHFRHLLHPHPHIHQRRLPPLQSLHRH